MRTLSYGKYLLCTRLWKNKMNWFDKNVIKCMIQFVECVLEFFSLPRFCIILSNVSYSSPNFFLSHLWSDIFEFQRSYCCSYSYYWHLICYYHWVCSLLILNYWLFLLKYCYYSVVIVDRVVALVSQYNLLLFLYLYLVFLFFSNKFYHYMNLSISSSLIVAFNH